MREVKPLVSVIVPVFNTERFLCECVESIRSQKLENLEIILVDDGSTDMSPSICDDYAKRDNRIKVIHKENGGVSAARNAGLEIARGKYFAFVDSDDIIDKNMYWEMYEAAQTYQVPLVLCSGYYFSETHRTPIEPASDQKEILSSHKMISDKLWSCDSNTLLFTLVPTKLFKHSVFGKLRFDESLCIHEDEEFSTRLYLPNYNVCLLHRAFYGYRKNESSLTYRPFNAARCAILDVLKMRSQKYQEIGLKSIAGKAKKNFLEIYITYYYQATKMNHIEWITKYRWNFFEFFLCSGRATSTKDKIRYCIFSISKSLYRKLFLHSA